MPRPLWKHYCSQWQRTVWQLQGQCDDCGLPGEFAGWHLTMWEQRAAYARLTGLKPTGGQRPLADMLLENLITQCPVCLGRGLVDSDSHLWRKCQRCDGNMRVRCAPEAELAATRRRLLREYPDAGVEPRRPPGSYPHVDPLRGVPREYRDIGHD